MSSLSHLIPVLSIFLLLTPIASADFLAPLLSPIIDELCKDILCGKGKCQTSMNHTLGYMCECDQGWKQATSDENKNIGFLPCVIPNCTLDYSCSKAQTPAPQVKDLPKNTSVLNPCNWAYCGGGSCIKSGTFGYKCECEQGHANLLNATEFPCFTECSLGTDCANLGITLPTNSTPSTTVSNDQNNNNQATPLLPATILWMLIFMLTIATIPCRLP